MPIPEGYRVEVLNTQKQKKTKKLKLVIQLYWYDFRVEVLNPPKKTGAQDEFFLFFFVLARALAHPTVDSQVHYAIYYGPLLRKAGGLGGTRSSHLLQYGAQHPTVLFSCRGGC